MKRKPAPPGSGLIALLLWLSFAPYTAGTLFADFQDSFPTIAKEERRHDMGMAWGIGIIGGPLAAGVSFFLTGFNEHGWRLK